MWRFLRAGFVPHQSHGVDYEAPREEPPAALGEAVR
jgi:hypothetical protein